MSTLRSIEPEWLDFLPAEDSSAKGSRRDIRRLNWLMLHHYLIAGALRSEAAAAKPRTILDIGAGDGTFMLALARRLAPRWPNVKVTLLDRHHLAGETAARGFASLGWQMKTIASDIFDFIDGEELLDFDAITANLF